MNVLFICTANRERSRTAEIYYQYKYPTSRFRSAGTNKYLSEKYGGIALKRYLIEIATKIICFEYEHFDHIVKTYGEGIMVGKAVYIINVGDTGNFMSNDLIKTIDAAINKHCPNIFGQQITDKEYKAVTKHL